MVTTGQVDDIVRRRCSACGAVRTSQEKSGPEPDGPPPDPPSDEAPRDPRASALDLLSNVSGVPHEEMLRLWEGVRDNQRRLDGCDGHDFEAVDVDEAKTKLSSVGQQARCRHCGGEMSLPMADQYRAGEARGIRTVLEDLDALQRVVDAVPEATLVNSGGKSTLDFIREAAQRRLDELAVMERSSVTAVAEPDAAIDPVKD